ncbi:MAG: carboxypeptidase regulatory-like domain-containing protein [Candidatus Diapherotrites archaeon]|nr:carboxypeptidase regulatory-like domain-containing protein [Candidatus Diapherotrites archaeon]
MNFSKKAQGSQTFSKSLIKKSQGSLEYLLLIGGAVLIAAVVVTLLAGLAQQTQPLAQSRALDAFCAPFDQITCASALADNTGDRVSDCVWDDTISRCVTGVSVAVQGPEQPFVPDVCGNGVCEPGESNGSCAADCPAGNGAILTVTVNSIRNNVSQPLANATAYLFYNNLQNSFTQTTNAQGQAVFQNLNVTQGPYTLKVEAAGYNTFIENVPINNGGNVQTVNMTLNPNVQTANLTVAITNTENTPLANVPVFIVTQGPSPSQITNAQGEVTFTNIVYEVGQTVGVIANVQESPDYLEGYDQADTGIQLNAGNNETSLALQTRCGDNICVAPETTAICRQDCPGQQVSTSITAKIISANTNDPLSGATITLKSNGVQVQPPQTTNAQGEVTFTIQQEEGTTQQFQLEIEAEAHLPNTVPIPVIAGQANNFEFTLQTDPAAFGTTRFIAIIENKNRSAISNAIVQLYKGNRLIEQKNTNSGGFASFNNVDVLINQAETFRIETTKTGYHDLNQTIELRDDYTSRVMGITLIPAANPQEAMLTVTVEDSTGSVISGATVKLLNAGVEVGQMNTNTNGIVVFNALNIRAGQTKTYDLEVNKALRPTATGQITLGSVENKSIIIIME